jgi:hypothetical protein
VEHSMSASKRVSLFLLLFMSNISVAQDVMFADQFKGGLVAKWENVGLKKGEFRFHKEGGLELRVQPGKLAKETPLLKVNLPFNSSKDTVIVSVKVTLLNEFTEDHEIAGVYLTDESGREFGAKQERVDGKMVYAPGNYRFIGKSGEEGDPKKYMVNYVPVKKEANILQITVDRGNAFAQFGPFDKGLYDTTFHSALRKDSKQRGFCLSTSGAPKEGEHWVRFEDFKVIRR